MSLSHEHVGYKLPAKIQIYILTRAELLITLCYEIPCRLYFCSEEYKLMITTSNCLFISVEKILAEHPFDVVQQLEFTLQTLLAVSLRSFDFVEKLAPDGQ